jgi:hypothetical protein
MFVAEVKNFNNFSKVYVGMISVKSRRNKLLHKFQIKLILKYCIRTVK